MNIIEDKASSIGQLLTLIDGRLTIVCSYQAILHSWAIKCLNGNKREPLSLSVTNLIKHQVNQFLSLFIKEKGYFLPIRVVMYLRKQALYVQVDYEVSAQHRYTTSYRYLLNEDIPYDLISLI